MLCSSPIHIEATRLFVVPFNFDHHARRVTTNLTSMASRKKPAAEFTSIEHGSFDTAALQQELAQALEDDRVYKLTDNMKKRAIHTAANYDEFKVRPPLVTIFWVILLSHLNHSC